MELTSTWNYCTLGSILCCLFFLLLLNKNDQILKFWASTTSIHVEPLAQLPNTTTTISSPSSPPPSPLKLSNFSTLCPPPQASVVAHPLNLSINVTKMVTESFKSSINVTSTIAFKKSNHIKKPSVSISTSYARKVRKARKRVNKKKCNMFDGKWVYKPDGKPSYIASQCPFLEEKMSCQRNRRPDNYYEKWTWVANDCNIPLLNGKDMVEKLRNKRVIFVGDSLNRNMWASLACILYSNIPNASSKVHFNFGSTHRRTFLNAKDEYNFTVEFYWTPYLVERNMSHSSGKRVLILDKVSSNSASWVGADIMIFNSGMHWIQKGIKKGWDLYEYNGKLIENMPLHIAYKHGMKTWAKWVQEHVDPKKTSIFYRSISAEHLNKKKNQWCVGKTKPIMDESYVYSLFPQRLVRAIEDVIKGMRKSRVKYLNITKLSRYRIDAHPSIYRYKDWPIYAKQDYKGLTSTADCGHWCLPGVPDTWNRMLYAYLHFDSM